MRRFISILTISLISCNISMLARVIKYPSFTKTDNYQFHVDSIDYKKTETILYLTYFNLLGDGAWANINKETVLVDENGKQLKLLSSEGLPMSPDKHYFKNEEVYISAVLHFPKSNSKTFNLIENAQDKESFNIYGINTEKCFSEIVLSSLLEIDRLASRRDFYLSSKNYDKVISLERDLLMLITSVYGDGSVQLSVELCKMSQICFEATKYEDAVLYEQQAVNILSELYPTGFNYSGILGTLADNYSYINEYSRSIEICKKAIAMDKKFGELTEKTAKLYSNLATYFMRSGKFSEAVEACNEAVNIHQNMLSINSESYINLVCNLASMYFDGGHYDQALSTIKSIINNEYILERPLLKSRIYMTYARCLNELGNRTEALKYALTSESLTIENYVSLTDLYDVYSTIFTIYLHGNDYTKAEEYCLKWLKLSESPEFHDTNTYFEKKCVMQASLLIAKKNFSGAVALYDDLYNSKDTINLSFNDVYWLTDYAFACNYIGRTGDAALILSHALNIVEHSLGKDNSLYRSLLYEIADSYFSINAFDKTKYYLNEALDLLKNEIYINFNNLSSKDKEKYWKEVEIQFLTPYSMLYNGADSLASICYNCALVQKGFMQSINDNSTQTKDKLDVTFNTIQRHLGFDDLAIEFVRSYNDSSVWALLLKKQWKEPKALLLDLSDFKNGSSTSASSFWEKIVEVSQLKKGSTIYFAGEGLTNVFPLENLYINDNKLISDNYKLFRMTSTMELLNVKSHKTYSIVLYGGLTYDQIDQNEKVKKSNERCGFEYLPYSLTEVTQISDLFKNMNCESYLYTESNGSEETIKQQQHRNANILHFATHGYYDYSIDSIQSNYETYHLSNQFDKSIIKNFDVNNRLNKSYLVLSGANRNKNNIEYKDLNDGILTSEEISHIDLSNFDLVVMPACKSGLGDVTNDGVIGLQYAFKKAGVNSILMSVDAVDDRATQLLMVEFYKNLLSGKTKHDSLLEAQRYLRMVENGKYQDSKYWASFILLDALN